MEEVKKKRYGPAHKDVILNTPEQREVDKKFIEQQRRYIQQGAIIGESDCLIDGDLFPEAVYRAVRNIRRFLLTTDAMKYYKGNGYLDVEAQGFLDVCDKWLKWFETHKNPRGQWYTANTIDEKIGDFKDLFISQDKLDIFIRNIPKIFYRRIRIIHEGEDNDDDEDEEDVYSPECPEIVKFLESLSATKHEGYKKHKICVGVIPVDKFKMFFLLDIFTGARGKQLLRVTRKAVNLEQRTLNPKNRFGGKKQFSYSFFPPELVPILKDYMDKYCPTLESKLFEGITRDDIKSWYIKFSKESGVPMYTKTGRKVNTNQLFSGGLDPSDIIIIQSRAIKDKAVAILFEHYLKVKDIKLILKYRAKYDKGLRAMRQAIFGKLIETDEEKKLNEILKTSGLTREQFEEMRLYY